MYVHIPTTLSNPLPEYLLLPEPDARAITQAASLVGKLVVFRQVPGARMGSALRARQGRVRVQGLYLDAEHGWRFVTDLVQASGGGVWCPRLRLIEGATIVPESPVEQYVPLRP